MQNRGCESAIKTLTLLSVGQSPYYVVEFIKRNLSVSGVGLPEIPDCMVEIYDDQRTFQDALAVFYSS